VHIEPGPAVIGIVLTDDGRPFRNVSAAMAFQPFSGAFRYGSTGLGFVIARDVIEAHGGSIAVRANPARSGAETEDRTCIVLTLPA
jgi:signal transduction histidine kinase